MAGREIIYIAQFYLFVALNFSVDSGHLGLAKALTYLKRYIL